MNVVANGKNRQLLDGATIQSFLDEIGWKKDWVVVEHNGDPLERTRYESTQLNDGDRIEVVRAVAGG